MPYDPVAKAHLIGPLPADTRDVADRERRTTLRYVLLADTDTPDPPNLTIADQLLKHADLPKYRDNTPHGRVADVSLRQVAPRRWEATVTLESTTTTIDRITTDLITITDGLYYTSPADPTPTGRLTNSAGDAFVPPPPRTESILIVEATAQYDPADAPTLDQAEQDNLTLNADRYEPYRYRSLLLEILEIQPAKHRKIASLRLRIKISPTALEPGTDDYWDYHLLDHGPRWRDDTGQYHAFTDDTTGRPTLGLLDGTGKPLTPGADPQWIVRPKYRETDWRMHLRLSPLWDYLGPPPPPPP
jgi:hypothetical protein